MWVADVSDNRSSLAEQSRFHRGNYLAISEKCQNISFSGSTVPLNADARLRLIWSVKRSFPTSQQQLSDRQATAQLQIGDNLSPVS